MHTRYLPVPATLFLCICTVLSACSGDSSRAQLSSAYNTGGPGDASVPFVNTNAPDTDTPLPASVQLDVPFAPQAPLANWDDPYQEACEEMSLIMVHHYLEATPLSREDADGELLALVLWETRKGYAQDVTLAQLAGIADDYYGYNTAISEEVTVENIKRQLANGHPVIVPAAGRDLGNPYFSGDGPWYHMLVITGYDKKRFITNDPGTKRGEGYAYKYDTIIDAVHDWTGVKENIRDGRKVMLIVQNNES